MEEAFYTSDRVMTFSIHKFKDYYPGTGHIDDIGLNDGKYTSVNFPLNQVNISIIRESMMIHLFISFKK